MKLKDVQEKLIALHKQGQIDGGYEDADSVDLTCKPLDDLEGFDSMLIPRFIRKLAKDIGKPLEKGVRVKNLYQSGREKLTLGQIAERFVSTYGNSKAVA